MSVRIAHRREVTDDPADISRRINEEVLRASEFRDAIDFGARVALKSEMIKPRFYFLLHHYQYESRIILLGRRRTEPDVVSAFLSTITNNREAADVPVEVNRAIEFADVDG